MSNDDWMNRLAGEAPMIGGKHTPAPALVNVTVAQAERAATSKKAKDGRYHGQYRQVTLRLRPETVREVEEWAAQLGISNLAALQRYIIWRGLKALQDGERPEMTQRTEMKEY
jgi:hypothetical protein